MPLDCPTADACQMGEFRNTASRIRPNDVQEGVYSATFGLYTVIYSASPVIYSAIRVIYSASPVVYTVNRALCSATCGKERQLDLGIVDDFILGRAIRNSLPLLKDNRNALAATIHQRHPRNALNAFRHLASRKSGAEQFVS